MRFIPLFHFSFKWFTYLALGVLLLVALLGSNFLSAKGVESMSDSLQSVDLNIKRYLDKTASNNLHHILEMPNDKWTPLKDQVTGYYFWQADYWAAPEGAVLWLKVQLPEDERLEEVWLELLPNLGFEGEIALFDEGEWAWHEPVKYSSLEGGSQPAKYLTFLFDYSLNHKTAYIRLTTEQTFQFSLKARSFDDLPLYFMGNNLFFGFVAGMLFLALIYNLVIGLNAKEPVYLYYAFYVFCNLLYTSIMEGYPRLLFPNWGNSALVSNTATVIFVVSAIMFIRQFLETRISHPRFDVLLRTVIIFSTISVFFLNLIPAIYAYILAILIGTMGPFLGLIGGVLSYRQGHPMAKYFMVAWLIFLISSGCWGWMWLGAVEPKGWVVWFYLTGTLLEVVLLSMVLGFRFNTLKAQTQTLSADKTRYRVLSETDELTQVLNRRGFINSVERYTKENSNTDLVWLGLDVDHFKSFNDQYGHFAGDELLAKMGELLNKKSRKDNIVGRVGGEEFSVLLVNCSLAESQNFIDRLLSDFASITVTTENGQQVGTTLSIGATAMQANERVEHVWKRADKLLYQAKEQGRNRAVLE